MMGILNIFSEMNLGQWAELITIIGFPVLIFSLYQLRKIARSQNNISINMMMFNDATNVGIMDVIQKGMPILKEQEEHKEHEGMSILKEQKGKFTSAQLDKYLGDFETLSMVYREGLLTEEQMEESFSYYIEQLGQNLEVKKYLESYPRYFLGYVF